MNSKPPLSIYVHIPFCLKKCGYCDFHSIAVRPENAPQREYALAVREELRQLAVRYGLNGRRVGTIYFGGGTPTVFESANLKYILDAIYNDFAVDSDAEISIEANPETIPLSPKGRGSGVRGLLNVGFNRISIGIQSFSDKQLNNLGRIHSAETARCAVRIAQEAGFKNIGIDLMWGLPGQTLKELGHDIDTALALGVQHVSAYQLTINQCLSVEVLKCWSQPHEELAREMFLLVHDKLTSEGYEHYEISNFAKIPPTPPLTKGGDELSFRCRHNLNYWRYGEWLGIGSGATSFIQNPPSPPFAKGGNIGSRFTTTKDISKYLRHEFSYDIEEIPLSSTIAEYSFMNLRTSDGIDLNDFKRRFGRDFDEFYPDLRQKWLKSGWIEANRLTLSGWLISDELFRELV